MDLDSYLPAEADMLHEEELLRTPFSLPLCVIASSPSDKN